MNKKIENDVNIKMEDLIIECAKYPEKRNEIFEKLGQKILKPLSSRELEEKTFEVFQLILKHEKQWKGFLLVPLYYRQDKVNSNYRDVWYTLKEYIAWCFLYPSEVDEYFNHNQDGSVEIIQNPKVRIMDKDNIKQVYKNEAGKTILVNVKKEKNVEIASGFTLGQKDSILNVIVAGLIKLPENYHEKMGKIKDNESVTKVKKDKKSKTIEKNEKVVEK